MAYYHPCKNCAVDPSECAVRQKIKDQIAGLSVTSIKFKCKERTSRFRQGQRVEFDWSVYSNTQISQDEFDTEVTPVKFVGTVIHEKSNKLRFVVRVDRDQEYFGHKPEDVLKNDDLIISVRPDDIKPLDDPDRSFCPSCLAYDKEEASKVCQGWLGDYDPLYRRRDIYHPDGCLLTKSELK